MTNSQADYTLVGQDLTGFWLQPGFVEGIVADARNFPSLKTAYQHIFRRNLEYAIFLWNGIPVRLSYIEDIPCLVVPLIDLLTFLLERDTSESLSINFETPNLSTEWRITPTPEIVTLEGFWSSVSGNYEAALNHLGLIQMSRQAFLCEWKLLLEQLNQAMIDSEAVLTNPKSQEQLETLRAVEAQIPSRGRFYQY